jgi:replication factor A1
MKISELNFNSRKVSITAKAIEKREPREVNTRNGRTTVTNAVLEDETGTIILVLWGDESNKVNEGDTVKIDNGYITEWSGQLQLNVGKFGKMTVL